MIRNRRLRSCVNGTIRRLYIMRFAFLAILTRIFGMVNDPERANVRTVFNCFVSLATLTHFFDEVEEYEWTGLGNEQHPVLKRFTRCRTRSPRMGFSQAPEEFNCGSRFGFLAILTLPSVGTGQMVRNGWTFGITRAPCGYGWQSSDAALHSGGLAASEELSCGNNLNQARGKIREYVRITLTHTPRMYSTKTFELWLALRKVDKQLTILGHWLDLILWPNEKKTTTDRRIATEPRWRHLIHLTPAPMTGAWKC